jgi:uncharacterized protein
LDVTEKAKALVKRFIEAMGHGDRATFEEILAPDAVAVSKGFGKTSGVRTRAQMRATAEMFKQFWPTGLRPIYRSFIAEGEQVAVEFEGSAVSLNGAPYCNQYCMVFTLEKNLIKQVNEYFCTILADQVMMPRPHSMDCSPRAPSAGMPAHSVRRVAFAVDDVAQLRSTRICGVRASPSS